MRISTRPIRWTSNWRFRSRIRCMISSCWRCARSVTTARCQPSLCRPRWSCLRILDAPVRASGHLQRWEWSLSFLCPRPGGIKRWRCLTSVAYIRLAGGVCGRPAGWRVLADRARLGRPGTRLPLRASVAGLGGGISWRLLAYSLSYLNQNRRYVKNWLANRIKFSEC